MKHNFVAKHSRKMNRFAVHKNDKRYDKKRARFELAKSLRDQKNH